MRSIFFGHGNPMNALESNEFTQSWKSMTQLSQPSAIIIISAHWQTNGTKIFTGLSNKMIYDFYGFPEQLSKVQYLPPSYPSLAKKMLNNKIEGDDTWGLDHGAWSVLIHAFPDAEIPVIQMSLDKTLTIEEHFELGKTLNKLRDNGILIVGSGNIVHNLRLAQWTGNKIFDWAENIQNEIINLVKTNNVKALIELTYTAEFKLAHPTIEHFLPLLYVIAQADEDSSIDVHTPKIDLGTISMASFVIN